MCFVREGLGVKNEHSKLFAVTSCERLQSQVLHRVRLAKDLAACCFAAMTLLKADKYTYDYQNQPFPRDLNLAGYHPS